MVLAASDTGILAVFADGSGPIPGLLGASRTLMRTEGHGDPVRVSPCRVDRGW